MPDLDPRRRRRQGIGAPHAAVEVFAACRRRHGGTRQVPDPSGLAASPADRR